MDYMTAKPADLTNASRGEAPGRESPQAEPRGEADPADAALFREAMARRPDMPLGRGSENKIDSHIAELIRQEQEAFLRRLSAEAPAQAEGAQMPGDAGLVRAEAPQPSQKADAAPAIDPEALETLVSRILVGTPEKGGAEVRITLEDNVLRGAEISIIRDNAGMLRVSVTSDDAAAFQTLVSSRDDLVRALSASEDAPVEVTIRSEAEDAGTDRRSRGLYDAYDKEAY